MRLRTFLAGAILLPVACSYYDSSLLVPSHGSEDSSVPPVCEHATYAPKPSVSSAGGDKEFTVAFSQIDFGDRRELDGGIPSVGFDLDRYCTCQGEDESCQGTNQHCDAPGGRDNGLGTLLYELNSMGSSNMGTPVWNQTLRDGAWTVILRVSGYNEQPDDDQVEIDWYVTDAIYALDPDGGKPAPKWDGTDSWPISSMTLEPIPTSDGGVTYDTSKALYKATNAYVSKGYLVGDLPKGVIAADTDASIVLTDAFVTGRLIRGDRGWEIQDGVLAAIWLLEDVFKELHALKVAGAYMCKDHPLYSFLKTAFCMHADIYHSRGTPTSPCDAISIGVDFTAIPAQLGQVTLFSHQSHDCAPGKDPSGDRCL